MSDGARHLMHEHCRAGLHRAGQEPPKTPRSRGERLLRARQVTRQAGRHSVVGTFAVDRFTPRSRALGFSAAGERANDEETAPRRSPTACGSGVSGGSCEVSSQAKNRYERTPPQRHVIADCSSENRVAGLERIEDGAERRRPGDVDLHVTIHSCQRPEGVRQLDSDRRHHSVWTSTTAACRSQSTNSPLSAEVYT